MVGSARARSTGTGDAELPCQVPSIETRAFANTREETLAPRTEESAVRVIDRELAALDLRAVGLRDRGFLRA